MSDSGPIALCLRFGGASAEEFSRLTLEVLVASAKALVGAVLAWERHENRGRLTREQLDRVTTEVFTSILADLPAGNPYREAFERVWREQVLPALDGKPVSPSLKSV